MILRVRDLGFLQKDWHPVILFVIFFNYIDSSKGGGGGTYVPKCSQVDEMIEMC